MSGLLNLIAFTLGLLVETECDILNIVPFLKIAQTMYIHYLIKNLFDFALVRLK